METRKERRTAIKGRKYHFNNKRIIIIAAVVVFVIIGITATVNVVSGVMEQRRLELEYQAKLAKYPMVFEDLVARYSKEYELDPAFMYAIIWCESTFNPKALSSKDARGLMQIMPDTGAWLAGKFDEEDAYIPDVLFDPETNIKYASWYLNYLGGLFDFNLDNMAAAYHSGQGTVGEWLLDPLVSADGKTLTDIPDDAPNTENYIRKVRETREIYQELYFPVKTAGEETA